MRIFISHASKNREIVLKFAEFLEAVGSDIEVFCSSEEGSIGIGKKFIETIFNELNNSDLFVPVISEEYYESKFCMIELGVAYSYLYNQYSKQGEDYIYPFALYPVRKAQALAGSPLQAVQVGNLNDERDVHNFLKVLSGEKGVKIGTGVNRELRSLRIEIDKILTRSQDIVGLAKVGAYFDDSIEFVHREDIASASVAGNTIVLNYNINPYEKQNVVYPNFVSVAMRYVDGLDIGRYLDFNENAEFCFTVINFMNSLKRIFVEFKYSDNIRILETFEFPVCQGENRLSVPLKKMKSKALNNISEICFVIHPDDVVEEEGMFKVGKMEIK